LGWSPELTIRDSIVRTLDWLRTNEYAWRDRVGEGAVR
jgi:dTDP-D-glucose 4,6-dehydratase